ncbi:MULTISPECIES: hypothetical protein [unclassified Streptomyces]|uniref:hypothetical protein n=1 Tax=unclassified Streptomyces TaxID=2593676 RepID=UPI003823EA42
MLYDFAKSVEMFADDEDGGDSEAPAKWCSDRPTPHGELAAEVAQGTAGQIDS